MHRTTLGGLAVWGLLSACAGQNASSTTGSELFYIGEDGSRFAFTHDCVENMRLRQSVDGRDIPTFDMKHSPECYLALDEWVAERIGQDVTLHFGKQVISRATIQSSLGARNIRVSSHDSELLNQIHESYGGRRPEY